MGPFKHDSTIYAYLYVLSRPICICKHLSLQACLSSLAWLFTLDITVVGADLALVVVEHSMSTVPAWRSVAPSFISSEEYSSSWSCVGWDPGAGPVGRGLEVPKEEINLREQHQLKMGL